MQFNIFIQNVLRRKKGSDSASFLGNRSLTYIWFVYLHVSDLDIKDKRMWGEGGSRCSCGSCGSCDSCGSCGSSFSSYELFWAEEGGVPGIHPTAQNSKIDGKLYMYGYRRDRRRPHRHKMLFISKRGTSPWCTSMYSKALISFVDP